MVGVEDEHGVEDLGGSLLGLLSVQHEEEIGGMWELRVRVDDREPLAIPIVVGDERRHQGDEPDRLSVVRLGGLVPAVRIVRRGCGDARSQHRHRRGLLGEGGHQGNDEVRRLPLVHHLLGELLELDLVREADVVEEEDDFLEGGVLREIVDRIPRVPELPELAVDVGDRGLRRNDVLEPLQCAHGHAPIRLGSARSPKFTN